MYTYNQVSDKHNEIKMMRIVTCFILIFTSFGIHAQNQGKYIGNSESTSNFLKSKSLELKLNYSFELIENIINLEFEIPQQKIQIITGEFLESEDGIILISENLETKTVIYKKQNQNKDKQNALSRKESCIPVDTTTVWIIPLNDKILLYKYMKPNSIYLCNAESNEIFSKLINTEKSYDLTFYVDEILANHRINRLLNEYERRYRAKLNVSDSLLIDKQVDTIVNVCRKFTDYVLSKDYSGEYIKELTRKLIEIEACPLEIFDLNYYFFPHENSLRPWELMNYPIRTLINKDENIKNKLFLKMFINQVVCNSEYIKHIPNTLELDYARMTMNQYKEYILNTQKENLSECEIEIINNLAIKK